MLVIRRRRPLLLRPQSLPDSSRPRRQNHTMSDDAVSYASGRSLVIDAVCRAHYYAQVSRMIRSDATPISRFPGPPWEGVIAFYFGAHQTEVPNGRRHVLGSEVSGVHLGLASVIIWKREFIHMRFSQ